MTAGFQALLHKLADPDIEVPPADLSELSDLSRDDLELFRKVWENCTSMRRRYVIGKLGELAEEHIELIFEHVNRLALEDPDSQVRESAIANLWECELPDLASSLIQILEGDPSLQVRARAAKALGRFVYLGEMEKISSELHQQTEEALLRVLHGPEQPPVKQYALESLGYSSRAEASVHISRAYGSEDPDRRRSAVVAMGRSYDRQWLSQIETEMNSPDPGIRAEAARAAGELEAGHLTGSLAELLDDGSDQVRRAAIWSLGQIGGEPARDALLPLLEGDLPVQERDLIDDALDHISFLETTPDLSRFEPDDGPEPGL